MLTAKQSLGIVFDDMGQCAAGRLPPMQTGWHALVGMVFGGSLLALAWIDWRTHLLPDILTLSLGAAGFLITWLAEPTFLVDHLIGATAGLGILTALIHVYRLARHRDGLGGGDAKLLGAIGAWVGWQGLPTVMVYAALSGLAWVLIGALRGRSLRLDTRLPFGPWLCLGGWLVWLYGPLVLG
ncbi:MAG: prepilin peptidase [Pseudomonadota bacterium]